MKSIRAAANSTSSTKKKKSAAARFHVAEADEDEDDVEFVASNKGPPKRKTRRNTQHDMMNWRAKVKSETPFRNYLAGESNCPECRTRNYKEDDGCKLITCTWFSLHKSGQYVYYCGHCGFLSPNGDPPKCPCHGMWGREAREAELEKPIDDDYEDTSTHAVSRESKQSSSTSSSDADEMDSNGGSNDIDSDNTMTTASESDLNEDEDDAKEVPTSSDLDVAARAIKQEPDTVASTAYDDDTVIDVTLRPQEVKSADIPVEVKAEVASSSTAPYAYDDDTDVEDSASSKEKDGEGDDVIYQESQRRKREAAEQEGQGAAAPKNTNINFDSSPVDQGGIIEAEFEAQTSGTRHSPPPLTLTGPTTTVTEDLGFIRHQWPRVARQRLSEELKQILLNLLKSYDTRAVASFIRTEVSENKQMRTKSPYNDDTFNAIFSRLENLKNSNKGKASSTRKASAATANRANNASQEKSNNARGGVPARGKRKSSEEEEEQSQSEVARKKYKYECPVDGCTNQVQNGGVCIKHGAEVKRCSSKGCTNGAIKGGVCKKHAVEQLKKQICMHGAKVKLCSSEGCTHYAFKGGVCVHCPPANLHANLANLYANL
eukprot:scaffold6670_cov81-Skeletonema_dohrnii-CCMP3373.AAC.2